MKLRTLLTVSAIYMAILGVGFMFAPRQIGIDAVPTDAPPALIAYLRLFGAPFLGIAVLNWMARDAQSGPALRGIVLGNTVGFTCAAAIDLWGVFSGARSLAKMFLVVHLLLAVAFALAARGWKASRE